MKNFHQSSKTFKSGNGGIGKQLPTTSREKKNKQPKKEGENMDTEIKSPPTPRNAIYPAKDIVLIAPESFQEFIDKGNVVFIPVGLVLWLRTLVNKPDVGMDAKDAIRNIRKLQKQKNGSLQTFNDKPHKMLKNFNRDDLTLQIIAAAATKAKDPNSGFDKVKLVSNDDATVVVATHFANMEAPSLIVSDYFKNRTSVEISDDIPTVTIDYDQLNNKKKTFNAELVELTNVSPNNGVIVCSNFTPGKNDLHSYRESFIGINKGSYYDVALLETDIFGIRPYSKNVNEHNWSQEIAIKNLLDPTIDLCIIAGEVGSGKTLLSVACALHLLVNKKYKKLVITRPMIPFAGQDNMGYLPGDKAEKMKEWLQPIYDAIDFLTERNKDLKNKVAELRGGDNPRIVLQSLDHIRGRTYHDCIILIDEPQNMTPHQAKCALERVGENSKMIMAGSVDQVDGLLGKRSNGFAVTIEKMSPDFSVSVTKLQTNERSRLSALVSKKFKL